MMKQPNWKAPGPDGISAYWYKAFPGLASVLGSIIWEVIDGDMEVLEWLVKGRTVLIPKAKDENFDPSQFRPITCLNTCYKSLTGEGP